MAEPGDTERPTQPEQPKQPTKVTRREFLKKAGLAVAAAGAAVGGIAVSRAIGRKQKPSEPPEHLEISVVSPKDATYRSIDLQGEEDRRKFERTHKLAEHFRGWSRSGWGVFRFGVEKASEAFEEMGSSRIVKAGTEIPLPQDRLDPELNPNTEIRIDEYLTSDGRRVLIFKVTGLRKEWYREWILDPPQDQGSDMAVVVFQNTYRSDETYYFGIRKAHMEYPAFELVEMKPRE